MKNNKLISCSGKKRNGKDTVADMIVRILAEEKGLVYKKIAFGTAVKQVASLMTGIPANEWETTEQKEMFLGPEWDKVDEDGNVVRMTRRKFLTTLGSDAVTAHLHQMAWINMTFKDYTPEKLTVVSDTRFYTELNRVNKLNGYTIRVINPRVFSDDTHPSEVELDDYTGWDFVVINDGTLEELELKVRAILRELKLI
jgi:hypothetical protein